MLKMKIDNDITTKLDKLGKITGNSDIDISYLKGIVDTFQYVGGDFDELFEKQDKQDESNASDLIPTIGNLSLKTQTSLDHQDLKFDLLENQAKLSKREKELKSATLKLKDRKADIENLKFELEHKNIQLSFKDNEISRLASINKTMNNDVWIQNTNHLRNELRSTQNKLSDKQNEVKMLQRELEQRNILLSRVDNRLKEMHLL